jgi:hypothetical protein
VTGNDAGEVDMVLLDVGVLAVERVELSLVKSDLVLQVGHPLVRLQVEGTFSTEFLYCEPPFCRLVLFSHAIIYNE